MKLFRVKKMAPGQRFFIGTDTIDSFNLLMRGKIGIFYPDKERIQAAEIEKGRIQCCNQAEAERRKTEIQDFFITKAKTLKKPSEQNLKVRTLSPKRQLQLKKLN